MRQLKYINKFHPYALDFKRHCKEGKLPNYVVIEQRYLDLKLFPGNDDHPSHDVAHGQRLVKEVYEALRSSPQWNETLLVITYDEHGGFFDHVPTPVDGVPSPDGIVSAAPISFAFDRLGVRVPAMLVSPWIEPGTGTRSFADASHSRTQLVTQSAMPPCMCSDPPAVRAGADVAVRALVHPGDGEEDLQPQGVPHQA
jgi:phospholipase C